MIERLEAELARAGSRFREVEVVDNVGWVPCPMCSLPFQPGTRLIFDVKTKQGVCADCGPTFRAKADDTEPDWDLPF